MKQKLLFLPLTLVLFLIFATPAFAQGPGGGRVVFGDNLTLEEGETIPGDVVVFGGNVTMKESSKIEGELAVFGGKADIKGVIEGNVAVMGGNIELGDTAVIEEDVILFGGKADIDEAAVIEGSLVNLADGKFDGDFEFGDDGFTMPSMPDQPEIPSIPQTSRPEFPSFVNRALDFFGNLARIIAGLVVLAIISWAVATFMPEQMKQVGDTVAESGLMSFGFGLLTMILCLVIGIPLLITICLAFIPILAYILIGIAVLFGWIAIGQLLGERLLTATGQPYPNFVASTVVGVLVLTIVVKMPIISWIPCIGIIFGLVGGLLAMVLSLTGLGAVLLTRFGTQPYTPRSAYSVPGGLAPSPSPRADDLNSDFSDLDINSASEAELRAKIKAVLAEADKLKKEPEPEPTDEAPSEPEEPEETPEDEKPDNPTPKTDA